MNDTTTINGIAMRLTTVPNPFSDAAIVHEHTFNLHGLYPTSQYPQAGSSLTIRYTAHDWVPEECSLARYITLYRGGHKDANPQLLLREMDWEVRQVAADCSAALGVSVFVHADLVIDTQRHCFEAVAR